MQVVVDFISIIFGVVLVAVVLSIAVAVATAAIPMTHSSDRTRTSHSPIRLQALFLHTAPSFVGSVFRNCLSTHQKGGRARAAA